MLWIKHLWSLLFFFGVLLVFLGAEMSKGRGGVWKTVVSNGKGPVDRADGVRKYAQTLGALEVGVDLG